jgi:chromatin assembly factor 1 subunit B
MMDLSKHNYRTIYSPNRDIFLRSYILEKKNLHQKYRSPVPGHKKRFSRNPSAQPWNLAIADRAASLMTSSTWPVLESDLGKSAVKWREMKLCTPQVAWHSKDPVYSVDFHCLRGFEWRLASAGTDKDVKIWKIIKQDGKVKLEFMSHLSRHCKPVNVVRFSPNGSMLASGSDDGTICLWVYCEDGQSGTTTFGEEDMVNREVWHVSKTLRGHLEDVYDVCWSPSSTFLLSCSFDESVIVWDVCKGAKLKIFRDSKQPSQGVCWDPRGDYFATLSRDRCLRIYSSQLMKLVTSTSKIVLPSSSSTTTPDGGTHKAKMYHDEGLRSFFRRLSYSPDGSLLITPGESTLCGDGL